MVDIRYKQRICEDKEKIDRFLSTARTGILSMPTDSEVYAVPLNFIYFDNAIYFHGLASGRKEDVLSKNPICCFNIYKEYGTVKDAMPCHADTAYFSIILWGKVITIDDPKEKADLLNILIEKYMPGFYQKSLDKNLLENYKSGHDNQVVHVHKLAIESLTAKENIASDEDLFEKLP